MTLKLIQQGYLDPQAAYKARLQALYENSPLTRCFSGMSLIDEMEDIFRLRYTVYCLEQKFLTKGAYPDCREIDEYDEAALHVGCYTEDDLILGTVRLVRPTLDQQYPFQQHCKTFPYFVAPDRSITAEVSRLMITKSRRGRQGDTLQGVPVNAASDLDESNFQALRGNRLAGNQMLLLAMFKSMYQQSKRDGIRYWYAAMELPLARQLSIMGFKFLPIGEVANYFGPAIPFIADLRVLEDDLRKKKWELWKWFNDDKTKKQLKKYERKF